MLERIQAVAAQAASVVVGKQPQIRLALACLLGACGDRTAPSAPAGASAATGAVRPLGRTVQTFGDWVVTCNRALHCEAIGPTADRTAVGVHIYRDAVEGPVSLAELVALARSGIVTALTQIHPHGGPWMPAAALPDLAPLLAPPPPPGR